MQNPLKVFSILKTFTLILVICALLFSFSFIFRFSDSNSDEIPFTATTEKLGIFEKYNNQIYDAVPSNGDYLIPEADVQSFFLPNDIY
ncbi:DKNYY family protein, partial [Acinetobacter guillouiae]